jgi:putative ABC transport system permease protein
MLFVALKRLLNRSGLTLLSIMAVILAIGLVVSIPVFAKAVSFVILRKEMDAISTTSGRPAFSMRVYVLPGGQYALPLDRVRTWENHIAETLATEVGLPILEQHRHVESLGLVLRTGSEESPYGDPHTVLLDDTNLTILPGVETKLTIVEGQPMDAQIPAAGELGIWMHYTIAHERGLSAGDKLEIYHSRRQTSIPVRIIGTWKATNPRDTFWFQNPDLTLRRDLLVREDDYAVLVEPVFEEQLGFAAWYLIMNDSLLSSENMREHASGLKAAERVVSQYLPDVHIDGSPLQALETSLERESDLTMLMFAFSVPIVGFLLYFLSLLSSITIRWQQRETAVMVSRGMRAGQLLSVNLIEASVIMGIGLPLGILAGIQLARGMGYTESFLKFTWRAPLPVSYTALNVPMIVLALSASLLARLLPVLRSIRTSVVAHERRRARAPRKPLWQRFYVDFVLVGIVYYAYRQLVNEGTLVPQATEEGTIAAQDPLLFLVPALFVFALSLVLIRIFPLLMQIGNWLSALGRRSTLYLAFRQLARQSGQYTSALLLVITSLGLGAFMASMAISLDDWLIDQVCYAVGTDVLLVQMLDPEYAEAGTIPADGAWMLPIESYLDLPGVTDAARVGMYKASIMAQGQRSITAQFMGVDRLDLPEVLFFRSDFAEQSLMGLMNQLALREDAVLASERFMAQHQYQVGDKIAVHISLVDLILEEISLSGDFTIAGTYRYFPTVYEQSEERATIIGNLDYLFERLGGPELHNIWLRIEPDADKHELVTQVQEMGVFVKDWVEAREIIAEEQAKAERVGIFGTLTIGFLGAAVFSGIGLLIYNYASLQERLFRFTILRAVGLLLLQIVSQVVIEYVVLMVYSVAGGAAIGVWASRLFIPFFQAADQNILRPPSMIPLIAWREIGRISGAFTLVLVLAQVAVISAAVRKGVFQALRLGDQE